MRCKLGILNQKLLKSIPHFLRKTSSYRIKKRKLRENKTRVFFILMKLIVMYFKLFDFCFSRVKSINKFKSTFN